MIYRNYFRFHEFLIDPDMRDDYADVPVHVADKIMHYHLPILNDVRDKINMPIIISKHSGYRPVEWELAHGRKGASEHTFRGNGAVDLTCENMELLLKHLLDSDYKRVCYYKDQNFIHCDFASDYYHYYEAEKGGVWKYKGKRK